MPQVELSTKRYFATHQLRPYTHPVVRAFAQPKIDWILSHIDLRGKQVLEVGAGNGYFSASLNDISRLTVLDLAEQQLSQNPTTRKQLGSVYELPFGDNTFDAVICSNLLHHLDRPHVALDEMRRVARTYVVVSEPSRSNPLIAIGCMLFSHERQTVKFSKRHVSRLIEQSGLMILTHTYIGGLVLPNGTPTMLLPVAGVRSRSRLSFFQIFICEKPFIPARTSPNQ
jgi:2-polyprenyl-3-methyl-5-hydroxy-6-metoxy-1,4-benzoquinol methylase